MEFVVGLAGKRREVPIDHIELDETWTTREGYTIELYKHVRHYPPELTFGGGGFRIVPGQTTEMRGWPCPSCGSVDTSCWGVTTMTDAASFQCHDCRAEGEWSLYCSNTPSPVHLSAYCDCPEPDWTSAKSEPGAGIASALARLEELHDAGVLNDQELSAAKGRLSV